MLAALTLILSEWLATSSAQEGAGAQVQQEQGGASGSGGKDRNNSGTGRSATPPQIRYQKEPLSKDVLARTSFAPVVKKVAPSVVTIYSTKNVENRFRNSPLFDDPFFRRFFGFGDGDEEGGDEAAPPPPRGGRRGGRNGGGGGGGGGSGNGGGRSRMFKEQSLGSGVIVSADGYILSNNHVVEGADEVKVSLGEGRADLVAKVVGTDPPTDISVLKVDAKDLSPITITDSANLEVGDTVMAVGNPFGVGQTVTAGIVSAVGRGGFGIVDYEDFIQTDASINPGNSGGPLVDVEGRLVGVNTAIISGTGGNMGIGFAVPANMVRSVMDRIIKDGRVIRGFLGVRIQPIDPDLAQELHLPSQSGALVGDVQPRTPAERAGIEAGDVITEFDGKKVNDSRHLRLMASQTPPGTKVKLKLLRPDKDKNNKIVEMPVTVTLSELPAEALAMRGGRNNRDMTPAQTEVLDGLGVTDIDNKARNQFKIPEEIRGALVTEVSPDSAAFEAGLRPGDVIREINRQQVRDADSAIEASKKLKSNRVMLRVWSRGGSRYVVVETGEKK